MDTPRAPTRRRDVLRAGGAALALPVVGAATAQESVGGYAPVGRYDVADAKETVVSDDGETAYVALTDGYGIVDLSTPSNPEPLAIRRNLVPEGESEPLRQIYDVKLDGDRLVVAGPAQRARLSGFFVVDVSTPSQPERLDFYETDYAIHNCFFRDGYVYLTGNGAGEGHPMVVVDTDLMVEVGRWSLRDRDQEWIDVPRGRRTLHDIYVQGDRAYLAYWDAGTWVVDVSDPSDPAFVTRFGDYSLEELLGASSGLGGLEPPGNSHYVQPNDDGSVVAVGGESWDVNDDDSGGPSGIDFWDVSDTDSPERLATIDPEESQSNAYNGGTWTTSHNFDWEGDRLYTSWYSGGVKLFDVSDPENPEQLSWWRRPEETSFWTAQCAVQGDFFVATSLGTGLQNTGVAGLFTFPDEAGEQEDAPPLVPEESSVTTTDTAAGNESDPDGGENGTDGGEDSDGGGLSGFGVGAALAGVGLGALRYRRNDNDS
jgi:hypothetical protein